MSKSKKQETPLLIDCSKKYLMEMYVAGSCETESKWTEVSCHYTNIKKRTIKIEAEGFDDKYCYEEFFDWCLYTGVIKRVEEK